jgi:hypothetical protein
LQDKNSNQEKDFSAQPGNFLSVVCEKIPTPEKGLKKKPRLARLFLSVVGCKISPNRNSHNRKHLSLNLVCY